MTSKKVKQLVLIKTSKQYLTRLVRALEQKAGQHDKFLRYSAESTDLAKASSCTPSYHLLVCLLLAKVEFFDDHKCMCLES